MNNRNLLTLFLLAIFVLGMVGCAPSITPAPATLTAMPNARLTPTVQPTAAPSATRTRPTAVFEVTNPKPFALVNGTLIDGTGADPVPDAVVVIEKGRIAAVGARAKVQMPGDAKIIDVQGATILPGLFNAHIHSGYSAPNLQAWAQAGVTTVRDLARTPEPDPFPTRNSLLKDNRNARLVAAGPMVTVPGGYPLVPWGLQGLEVTSPEDAAVKVNRLLDQGADVVKISLEAGATFRRDIPVLSTEQAIAIVQTAHRRGTRVSAHVTAAQDLSRVIDAGVDDVAHMVYNDAPDEIIQKIAKANMYWVPTVELWRRVGQGEQTAIANLKRFVAAGGKVALGTDYAGYAAQFELGMPMIEIEALQQAGMTPMQIIAAGTRNAAYVCNLDHELGTLQAGKIADVLVVNGDPLKDLRALTNVRIVIHNGEVIRGQE